MDKKAVIKNVILAIVVPTALLAVYWGYKYGKKKYDQYKSKKQETQNEESTNL